MDVIGVRAVTGVRPRPPLALTPDLSVPNDVTDSDAGTLIDEETEQRVADRSFPRVVGVQEDVCRTPGWVIAASTGTHSDASPVHSVAWCGEQWKQAGKVLSQEERHRRVTAYAPVTGRVEALSKTDTRIA